MHYQELYGSKSLPHVADNEEHVGDAEADQEVVEQGRHGSAAERVVYHYGTVSVQLD